MTNAKENNVSLSLPSLKFFSDRQEQKFLSTLEEENQSTQRDRVSRDLVKYYNRGTEKVHLSRHGEKNARNVPRLRNRIESWAIDARQVGRESDKRGADSVTVISFRFL